MHCLTKDIQNTFYSALFGLHGLLPDRLVKNRDFTQALYDALLLEPNYTASDISHIRTLLSLVKRYEFPALKSISDFVAFECYLLKSENTESTKSIQYALEYALFLFIRHGAMQTSLVSIRHMLKTWRLVHQFPDTEYGIISGYVHWLNQHHFSPVSIAQHLEVALKLRFWLEKNGWTTFETVSHYDWYLFCRLNGRSIASQKRWWQYLKPLFYYYKSQVDTSFAIPTIQIPPLKSVGGYQYANNDEISELWSAINTPLNKANPQAVLMLLCVIGLGLPLKALSLLRLTSRKGEWVYTEQRPKRQGQLERLVYFPVNEAWANEILQAVLEQRLYTPRTYPYLFMTPASLKRLRPVSTDYCQRQVQELVRSILGYPLPVNRLERGVLKAVAKKNSLFVFMSKTDGVPIGKQARMMSWLESNRPIPKHTKK